jgi:hypothetical protein
VHERSAANDTCTTDEDVNSSECRYGILNRTRCPCLSRQVVWQDRVPRAKFGYRRRSVSEAMGAPAAQGNVRSLGS